MLVVLFLLLGPSTFAVGVPADFPGQASELSSPGGRFVLRNVDSDQEPPAITSFWISLVPLMRVVLAEQRLLVADLFCGAGGLSEGFRQAGAAIIAGVDADPDACATYRLNFPEARSGPQPF